MTSRNLKIPQSTSRVAVTLQLLKDADQRFDEDRRTFELARAEAVRSLRFAGLSDRQISDLLGVGRNVVARWAATDAHPTSAVISRVRALWNRANDHAGDGWVREHVLLGADIMRLHGIEPMEGVSRADASACQYRAKDGRRVLIYSPTRWDGVAGDNRGFYRVEMCDARDYAQSACAASHVELGPDFFGLDEAAFTYGTGWNTPRPTESHVYDQLQELVTRRFEMVTELDPLATTLSTVPRSPGGPGVDMKELLLLSDSQGHAAAAESPTD